MIMMAKSMKARTELPNDPVFNNIDYISELKK